MNNIRVVVFESFAKIQSVLGEKTLNKYV